VRQIGNNIFQKPFIKKIETNDALYIYDVNSNELIEVDRLIYDIIDHIEENNLEEILRRFGHKYKAEELRERYEGIKELQKENELFSTFRPEICSGVKSASDVKALHNLSLSQIILELSNRCNLRCKYCAFSGSYADNRTHGSEDMSIEVAVKAVDYFIENSQAASKDNPAAITFYGGEPLLRLDVLKEVVEYTKKKGVFENYFFSLTTNGTLLTRKVIDYFVRNNIGIMISLDGPKEDHDRFRVFENGSGTFDAVIKNLKQIKAYNPEYFENKISFNAVISPPYNLDAVIDCFFKDDLFKPLKEKIKINFVNPTGTSFFKDYKLEKDLENFQVELARLQARYKEALINGTYDHLTIEKQLFLKQFYDIARRKLKPLEEKQLPLGTCIPGRRRLFVDTTGTFYMCEKVGAHYQIGNIHDGIDYERIYRFYESYDKFFEDCRNCWALRFCTKCFDSIRTGDKFDEKRRESLCKGKLRRIEDNIVTYCEVLKEKPDAFNFLEEVKFT
jgi:uncharacterized protein